jgi:hypothetical protein
MRQNGTKRMIVAAGAGIALMFTAAGSCGSAEQDDDEPAVTNQQPAPDDDGPEQPGEDGEDG